MTGVARSSSAVSRGPSLPARALNRAFAAALPRTPLPILRRLPGIEPIQLEGQLLDPHLQILQVAMETTKGHMPWEVGAKRARELAEHEMPLLAGRGPRMRSVEDIVIPGPDGPLAARVYRPRTTGHSAPAMVYFHGGGWVIGSIETHDSPCRLLAHEGRCVVISVDYRLAPEHPAPAAVNDATAAYRWVRGRAAQLDLDSARIGIGGDSAGGNLAAVVTQRARDEDFAPPHFALLIYPGMDMRRALASHQTYAPRFIPTNEAMDWYLEQYLPKDADIDHPHLSPLKVPEVRGLGPAHVVTAGFDPLRDEGEAYAARLQDAGIDCTVQRYPSMLHGFLNMIGSVPQARVASVETALALRRGLS